MITEDFPFGTTEIEIIRNFCREERLDMELAFICLVKAMVERHIDCELRKGGHLPPRPGGSRAEALVPAMDAVHERRFGESKEAKINELLFRLLTCCSILAETRIEKESQPKMRLVE